MPIDKPKWEDEEQTIMSFDGIEQTSVAEEEEQQEGISKVEDEEATVLGEPATPTKSFDDRTVVETGVQSTQKVEIMAWLVITKTPSVRTGQMFTLDQVRSDIGRGGEVSIFLNDSKVSSLHAAVKYESTPDGSDGQFVLYDMASTNYTFLNGERISSPTVLKDGDRITVGETELAFKRL